MSQDFIGSLKKNFETNYKRLQGVLGLKKFETVFGEDFVSNYNRLMEMYEQEERHLSKRAAGYFKGMIVLVSKINDLESPGWNKEEVKEGIFSCTSKII